MESGMSSFKRNPRRFGFLNRLPRADRSSETWIAVALVAFGIVLAGGFIYEYRSITSSDVIEQRAVASDVTPIPRWTANPTPVTVPVALTATPSR